MVSACLIGQFGLILWQKTSDGAYFFLVRAAKKIKKLKKNVLDQKIPQKIIVSVKVVEVYWNISKSSFFFFKKSKNIGEIQNFSNIYSFHSIVLPLCVSKQFSLSIRPLPKKSACDRKFFFPYWLV